MFWWAWLLLGVFVGIVGTLVVLELILRRAFGNFPGFPPWWL